MNINFKNKSMINIIFKNNTMISILAIELLNTIFIFNYKIFPKKLMVCLDNFSTLFGVPEVEKG
jgi:hypothetical protein